MHAITLSMASKLINIAPLEVENQLEVSLRQSFEALEPKLIPPISLAIPSPEEYESLNRAILYGVLTQPSLASVLMKHLHALNTDGYAFFIGLVIKVVNQLYGKVVDSAKAMLLRVAREMVDVWGKGFDDLLVALLRQIVGGDYGSGNLWLCFELVNLFLSRWDLLVEEEPAVLAKGLYVFLRLLGDHCRVCKNVGLEELKRLEIEFCVKVFREQFSLCLMVGRDLMRLLQDLVHVPEFRAILKDLVFEPGKFRTLGFFGVSQIYAVRTSSRYFLLRITPEMESQIRFLLTYVKLGSQKRHQLWFGRKFLSTPESETIVIDIVRFLCCAHHPSNEIIQSDIIPRWAVIGWLLKCCRKNYVEANIKLALFYDCLFFNEKTDNIMNIEPAMLLMVNSIPQYVDMTHTLLEFLILLVDNYDVNHTDYIVRALSSAFSSLVSRRVIHSFDVFTSCDAISPILKERLRRILHGTNGGMSK